MFVDVFLFGLGINGQESRVHSTGLTLCAQDTLEDAAKRKRKGLDSDRSNFRLYPECFSTNFVATL